MLLIPNEMFIDFFIMPIKALPPLLVVDSFFTSQI